MTPGEYLKQHKKWFYKARLVFHFIPLISGVIMGRRPDFSGSETWLVAALATLRHKFGEATEVKSNIETLAFYADKEFTRRMTKREAA